MELEVTGKFRALRERVEAWLVPALDPKLVVSFAREVAERNRRRLLALAPLVLTLHVVHVVVFHNGAADRARLPADILRWRDAVVAVHLGTFVVTAVLAVLLFWFGKTRRGRWLAPACVLTYLLHGALTAGADQISAGSGVAPFIGYCLFMAVVVSMRPAVAVAIYGIGLAAFVEALLAMQPSAALRQAQMPNGISIVFVCVVLSVVLYGARRREFAARATIEKQGRVLAELNSGLERRVQEQVSEIVKRAGEIERLNAQLQAQVRQRSTELSYALARLAQERGDEHGLRRGTVLGGRFEIAEALGEGGMGVVYAGIDRTTQSRVAIKVVQARSRTQLEALRRFLREAMAASTVAHPAIVRMLHVDISDDGMLYQAQELVEGETLQQALDRGRRWTAAEVARIGATLSRALAAAHARGIVHRDVKPSNVMLTSDAPGVKLLDFGIAKLYEAPLGDTLPGTTRSGAILGTPAYMSPEQIEGVGAVTSSADVYSVGVLLFVLPAGRHPFDERTPWGVAYSHICVDPPDVQTLAPNVPAAIADLVGRCLRKAPEDRPTAGKLAEALDASSDRPRAA